MPPEPPDRRLLRTLSIAYQLVQSIALVAYWIVLIAVPSARAPFVVPGAPDSTVLAFALGDLALYAVASLIAAIALIRRRRVWPTLLVHAGAAMYAASYALLLAVLEPSRWLGALMMLPALIVPPLMAWLYRPTYRGLAPSEPT
ncbi:MAG: hypothetical protein R3B68_03805 [Phycisphaerales bacterium]